MTPNPIPTGPDAKAWTAVEQKLKEVEAAYAEIGTASWFVQMQLRPLRDRWNSGERTPAIREEIEVFWKGM